jgi:hypothetical protein
MDNDIDINLNLTYQNENNLNNQNNLNENKLYLNNSCGNYHISDYHDSISNKPPSIYKHEKLTNQVYLDVIAVVSNPVRYKSRYKLFNEFCERLKKQDRVRLFTIELQHRARPFVTDANLKLTTEDELWHKENMINVAVNHLPSDWEYMAWIDADIDFHNKNWVLDTINQLQHYSIVQLFSHAIDLGPDDETMEVFPGFCYQWVRLQTVGKVAYNKTWHTGYAWAIRREAYNNIGGLIDWAILGAADHHMAKAFIGRIHESYPKINLHQNYKTLCDNFQKRCDLHIKQNIGYVRGTILHFWHGKKKDRKYRDRWQILVKNSYDPLYDIKKDCNNLWKLEKNKPKLRDDIRGYLRGRNEDSIDMEEHVLLNG